MQKNTGIVYLIHFEKPYKHARHYLGFCENENLDKRLARHRAGQGARLLEVVTAAGIKFEIVKTWHNVTRHFERKLKNRKSTPRLCPVCQSTH